MARLIRRSEALNKMTQMEEKALKQNDKAAADCYIRAFNAIMSCKVEERVFCSKCGKPIKIKKVTSDDDRGGSFPDK